MNVDFDLDIFFSLFDLAIVGLLCWGAWLGYSKGAIVQTISLFALVAALGISAITSKFIYAFFISNGSKTPDLFAALWLAGLFTAGIFGSGWVRGIVQDRVKELKKTKNDQLIGLGMGVVKMFLIISLYSFVIYNVDYYGHFLPKSEQRSKLGKGTSKVVPTMFKFLRWNKTRDDTIEFQNIDDVYENLKDSYPNQFNDEEF